MKIKLPLVIFLTAFLLAVLGCGNAFLAHAVSVSADYFSAYFDADPKNDSRIKSLIIEVSMIKSNETTMEKTSGKRQEVIVSDGSFDFGTIELDASASSVRIIPVPVSPNGFAKERHIQLDAIHANQAVPVIVTSYSSNKYYVSQYRLVIVKIPASEET